MLVEGAVPSVFAWTKAKSPWRKTRRQLIADEPTELSASDKVVTNVVTPGPAFDHDYSITDPEDKLVAARAHISMLEKTLQESNRFCLERFSSDNKLINFYTGFKDSDTLYAVFRSLEPHAGNMVRWGQVQRNKGCAENIRVNVYRDESLQLIDQFFMFLTRIRQGLREEDLAVRFNVSQSTVSRIILTWTNFLYFMLGSLPIWPDKETTEENMPESFQKTYPNTRVILDCTEIKVQAPSSKVLNSEFYSNYKSVTTFKGLIGISPWGSVSFVSQLYTGSISDKAITLVSGILDLIEAGDEVMADKGFLINDLLARVQASLVIPPFLGQKGQFTSDEVELTHLIARLRIHVERAIRRIKEYHIWDTVIPLSLAGSVNQLWTVCAILTNFRGPLF